MSDRASVFVCEGGRRPSDAVEVRTAVTAPGYGRVESPGGEQLLERVDEGGAQVEGSVFELDLAELGPSLAEAEPHSRLDVVPLADGQHALAVLAGARARPRARGWDHTSLAVRDLDRALAFYRELLGFAVDFEERGMTAQIAGITGVPGLECDIAQLRSPASSHVLELIAFRKGLRGRNAAAPVIPGMAHVAFSVEDLEAALGTLERLGGRVLGDVTKFEDGDSAYCREPAGSFLELSARGSPTSTLPSA